MRVHLPSRFHLSRVGGVHIILQDCASSAGMPRTNARTPTLSRADSAIASALWLPPDSALSSSFTSFCKVPQHTSPRYCNRTILFSRDLSNPLHLRRLSVTSSLTRHNLPSRVNRLEQRPLDEHLYASRNLVERFFCRIKQFRRVATRYDKLSDRFSSFVALSAAFIWIC